MKIIGRTGTEDLANVYLAETNSGRHIEFVESIQPPYPRDKKWVLIVSTLYGCPVGCAICDAGGWYLGKLTGDEILEQIDFLISTRYPDRKVPAKKFKIQFARMGDPSFNKDVLEILKQLPGKYTAPGLIPCISSVAPNGTDDFFEKLIDIKNEKYSNGRFQMQFSIHSTDKTVRDRLIPVKKWDFSKIADFGRKFFKNGDRKIALNFALAEDSPVDVEVLSRFFDPDVFIVKLTPINPTVTAQKSNLKNGLDCSLSDSSTLISALREKYQVIVSVGELEENRIGSNCGQYVKKFIENRDVSFANWGEEAYNYKIVAG